MRLPDEEQENGVERAINVLESKLDKMSKEEFLKRIEKTTEQAFREFKENFANVTHIDILNINYNEYNNDLTFDLSISHPTDGFTIPIRVDTNYGFDGMLKGLIKRIVGV